MIAESEEREIFRDVFESNDLHKSRLGFALFMNEYLKVVNLKKLIKSNIQVNSAEDLSGFLKTKINFDKIISNVEKGKRLLITGLIKPMKEKTLGYT